MRSIHPIVGMLTAITVVWGCQEPTSTPLAQAPAGAAAGPRASEDKAEPPAEIIVDNTDAAFRTEGDWQAAATGHDHKDGLVWAVGESRETARAIWEPVIPVAGRYAVYEWHGSDPNSDHATEALLTIEYRGGSTTVTINQQKNIGRWNLLGEYEFAAGRNGRVILSNKANGNVVADAIKFVYRGP